VDPKKDSQRNRLMGLGDRSLSKSYYPELRQRLEELEHFRELLNTINDTILFVETDTGRISTVVGAAHSMLGCTPEELTGTVFADMLPPHIRKHADALFAGKREFTTLEAEVQPPGCNASVLVELKIRVPSEDAHGPVIIVARDIRERKQAEEEAKRHSMELETRVRQRTQALKQANQAKDEFVSFISHELRTPMTSILGFTSLIRKKLARTIFPNMHNPDEKTIRDQHKILDNLNIIMQEGNRLTTLINDTLDLSKHEAERIEYTMRTDSIVPVIEQAMNAAQGIFDAADIVLQTHIADNLPPVTADADRLVQVLLNLLSNAAKFSEAGSTVHVRAQTAGTYVLISVEDSGPGIEPDMQDAVFDKFTQANAARKGSNKGTGLGLAICRHIIAAHGGRIWEESEPGKGSTFTFSLPTARS
jgi:PAS domain S-box-containing protein